ncbi:MAG: tRNA guanosine(34) transglycosylase Tgt, partial [Candidatus Hadarchaeum sp.]
MGRIGRISTAHGELTTPTLMPVIDPTDIVLKPKDMKREFGAELIITNAYLTMLHFGKNPEVKIHQLLDYDGPIMTDSGGFQAYSLIRQNPKQGRITDQGIVFQPGGAGRKFQLTPEKCIQLQLAYGADIVVCLDDCTHVDDPPAEQRASVRRTIRWAARCKQEFERQMEMRRLGDERPLLFAVVQGGGIPEFRRECAEALLEIGFDGYGYGGWPLDAQGNLLTDMLALTRELIPL